MTDADPTEARAVEDVDEEEAQLLLADPDDYHEAQRLRQIHEARRHVREALRSDPPENHAEQKQYRRNLANALTGYIAELEPVIKAADLDAELARNKWESLFEYADLAGIDRETGEHPHKAFHVRVFRAANEALAVVKPLLEEEDTDEWEV